MKVYAASLNTQLSGFGIRQCSEGINGIKVFI